MKPETLPTLPKPYQNLTSEIQYFRASVSTGKEVRFFSTYLPHEMIPNVTYNGTCIYLTSLPLLNNIVKYWISEVRFW